MKRVFALFIVIMAIIIILFLVFGKGVGFGGGNGKGEGNSSEAKSLAEENLSSKESEQPVRQGSSIDEKESAELPNRITVTIKQDKVYVEDKQIDNAEALKDYIEKINTDSKEYFLKDESSILETYEWVSRVFADLKIPLNAK